MKDRNDTVRSWRGKYLSVCVLHSTAGVAQQILVENGEGFILIDAGDGVLRDLLPRERNINEIKGILFTHGHFDHMGGLHSLLGFLRMIGREEDLTIVAPVGCTEVSTVVEAFQSNYLDTVPYGIDYRGVEAEEITLIDGLRIKAYPVIHCGSTKESGILDPIPAMGYRIEYRGEAVAVSGDTGNCPFLRELIRDADLAIIEATYPSRDRVEVGYLEKVHLSVDLAAEIGKTAREYILVHRGKERD